MTTPGRTRGNDGPPEEPLLHPFRRRILRRLHRHRGALRPRDVAAELSEPLARVKYHMIVLAGDGTVLGEPDADGAGVLYESAVAGDPEVIALLAEREEEDEDGAAA